MNFSTRFFLIKLLSILFPIFVFLFWFGLGVLFQDMKMGLLAGIGFGLFYGLRILWIWIKPLE